MNAQRAALSLGHRLHPVLSAVCHKQSNRPLSIDSTTSFFSSPIRAFCNILGLLDICHSPSALPTIAYNPNTLCGTCAGSSNRAIQYLVLFAEQLITITIIVVTATLL